MDSQQSVPAQSPATWYRSFHHLQQLLDAYAGQEPDDEPGKPSEALIGYLRTVIVTDPAAPVLAAAQARELVANGVLDSDDFIALELLPRPTGPSEHDYFAWLKTVAELCEEAADAGYPRWPDTPPTSWEWRRNHPTLHQLFAGYLGQDFDTQFPAAEHADDPVAPFVAAIHAWAATADLVTLTRALAECTRLTALHLDRATLETALIALGCDAVLPEPADPWLRRVSSYLWALCKRRSESQPG
ncbi:MAG TPA: hypothetical protein VFN97_15680 [Actinospica sp.]|nr:hypothetical protein [Actinospica sp.]